VDSSDQARDWVFLTYALPRTPSGPRIALWRHLRRLGVAQLADGLVALPADARTREQLEWAAGDVTAAGGQAGVWLARPTTRAQARELADSMNAARSLEYAALVEAATTALELPAADQRRTLRRLREEARRIHRRDYFRPPDRERARQALRLLADAVAAHTTAESVTTQEESR
jgi:uncharacterized protein YdbL (DUF1318 family)